MILDFSPVRCTWRALHRSREHADFWWWLLTWRRHYRPAILAAADKSAPAATDRVLRTPRHLQRFLATIPR